MVALLERIYRTRSAAQRPVWAAEAMTQLWGEEVAGVEQESWQGQLVAREITLLIVDFGRIYERYLIC